MTKPIILSFAVGLLAGGLAMHLYDGRPGGPDGAAVAPAHPEATAQACGNVEELSKAFTTLTEQMKKVPPKVEDKREDGTPYTRPNRLYEQLMLQMIDIKTRLDAAKACGLGGTKAG